MAHKRGMEALNKSMRNIKDNGNLMGGVTVLLAGDFRQALPVVPRGRRPNEIKASFKRSALWSSVRVLKLTRNIKFSIKKGDVTAGPFADVLLKIENGECNDCDRKVTIKEEFCTMVVTVQELFNEIYTDILSIQEKICNDFVDGLF